MSLRRLLSSDFGDEFTSKLERQQTSPTSFLRLLRNDFSDKQAITLRYREAKPYEKGFSAHYDQHIKPLAAQFEVKRKDALRKAAGRAKVAAQILTVVAGFCVLIFVKSGSPFHAIIPLMIAYGLLEMWFRASMTQYQDTVKSQIFPRILSFVGDFEYRANIGGRVERFARSGLIPDHDRESNEDEMKGSYKGVQIELFESRLESKRRSNRNTRWVTVFKGVIINLSMNKAFNGKTVIGTDRGAIGNFFKGSFSSLERVILEDPEFEKRFEVYSTDQVEARYLLTTSFMERLKELQRAFKGKHIEACFHQNSLLLMIPVSANLFEPGSIFVPEDFTDDARSLLAELQDIFAIIDTLKLDQNLNL
jgi:hypothetical protein